jgi:hypothetical protein
MKALWGRGGILPTHFRLRHWMGVSGQHHAPVNNCLNLLLYSFRKVLTSLIFNAVLEYSIRKVQEDQEGLKVPLNQVRLLDYA